MTSAQTFASSFTSSIARCVSLSVPVPMPMPSAVVGAGPESKFGSVPFSGGRMPKWPRVGAIHTTPDRCAPRWAPRCAPRCAPSPQRSGTPARAAGRRETGFQSGSHSKRNISIATPVSAMSPPPTANRIAANAKGEYLVK